MKTNKLILFMILAIGIIACDDDDDKVVIKDYGMKTFAADYNYDSEAGRGKVAYRNQIYFNFSLGEALDTAVYGTDSWTQFYLIKDSAATNFTSDVENWDIVFTNYTANLGTAEDPTPYNVTGALININKNIEVSEYVYEEYEDKDSISMAFSKLTIADISPLESSTAVDAIGYNWKKLDHATYTYTVSTNRFFALKLEDGNYYKMRFISFYGETTAVRVAKIEYQLMQ